jgi:hypothetical protein
MQVHQRPIFRERALHHHLHGREKDILPHFMALPVPVLLWFLLGLFLIAAYMAWNAEIPTYASGPGLVLPAQGGTKGGEQERATAIVFLPWEVHPRLHIGQEVQVILPAEGLTLSAGIVRILPGVTSPAATCSYYLQAAHRGISPVTRPSVAILVALGESLPARAYAGSQLTAQVEIGTQRLVDLLPGIGRLMGGQGVI